MPYDFNGKLVVVTGASAGIGAEVCRGFVKLGAKVVALDISDDVNDVAKELGEDKVFAYLCDVSSRDNVQKVVKNIALQHGKIDILVNNAGIVALDKAEDLSQQAWQKTIDVNLSGVFYMAQAVGKEMLKNKGGKIVNLASQAGVIGIENHVAYCAAKFGVIGITKVLAIEWAQHQINVNSVSPTVVLTELGKKAWSGEVGEEMKKKIPARRFAEPYEVVDTILFLASDKASMIHGENILIDGGYTAQ
ncbi:MAG: GolD/DthD family dehydrogenase [Alphaproteobacteria bacterium]